MNKLNAVRFFKVVGNATVTVMGDVEEYNGVHSLNNYESCRGYMKPNTKKHHIFFDYSDPKLFYKFLDSNICRITCKKTDTVIIHAGNFEKSILSEYGYGGMDKIYNIYNGLTPFSPKRIKFDRSSRIIFCTNTPTQYLRISQYGKLYEYGKLYGCVKRIHIKLYDEDSGLYSLKLRYKSDSKKKVEVETNE